MAGFYTVVFENVTVSASQDLFELTPADDKPVRLRGLVLSNVGGIADAGDAQEELLRLLVRRGHSTGGSGGTAPTSRPLDPKQQAYAGTSEVNSTTIASAGTAIDLHADGWNVRVPYVFWWSEAELRPQASQADVTIVVRLLSTPADGISVSGTLYFEEL